MPRAETAGLAYAAAGLLLWGLSPLYWTRLARVPALEILLHRVVWSAALLLPLVAARGRWRELAKALEDGRTAALLAATTLLVAFNWGLYIWAVNSGRIIETSLGYFMNPLVNVGLGVLLLGERLRAAQTAAISLAVVGVAIQAAALAEFPWLALALATSFAGYALLRKIAKVDALIGLAAETVLLAVPAALGLGWLSWMDRASFGRLGAGTDLLLALSSVVTALPLLWYTEGARRLDLKTLGIVQYMSPSCQFLLGVFVFREPMARERWSAFALIWVALAVYTADALRPSRRRS